MGRVIVVGAGMVGLAVAEELARRGLEVDLLEKNAAVAREASTAAAGILAPYAEAAEPGPFLDLLRAGYGLVPETVIRLRARTGVDVGYRATGMFAVAMTPEDERTLRGELAWQRGLGLQVEEVEGREIRRAEPAVGERVRWGVWWPQAAQLDVRRLAEAYEAAVRAERGRIHLGVAVRRFLLRGEEVVGVETSEGRMEADGVVLAAGPWSGEPEGLPFTIPTVPARGQILPFPTGRPIVERAIRSPRGYVVQRTPQELLAGTTVEYVGYDRGTTESGLRAIREAACEIAPVLSGLPLGAPWAGLRPDTPDHLPILGPTPFRRLLLATGHFRNGILLAPLTARLIAEEVTGGASGLDLAPFRLDRFLAKARL